MNFKYKVTPLLLFILNVSLFSQELKSKIHFFANTTDKVSWWYENNNHGKYIVKNELNYIFHKDELKTIYHAEISNAFSNNEKFSLGETYIKHAVNDNTFIRIGKYYRDFSLYLNDSLTMGSMLISKNAQPMPKIGIVTKYSLENRNIYFDLGIAHGYFDKNEAYKVGPFLHEKFIYINFKKNDRKIALGFVHGAMWGGDTIKEGKLPSSLKDFLKVFISDDGPYNPNGFHQNAIGNHLGIWDFYFEKVKDKKKLKLYYQHFFEDTSSLRFANKTDGLWGIEMENFLPETKILIEYLTTKNCCINPPYQDDDYYGNYQYVRGWRYKNNIIGNPLVNTLPVSNSWSVADKNRELVSVINFGLEGKLLDSYYQIQAFKSINTQEDIRYKIVLSREIIENINFNFLIANNMKVAGISYAF